MELQAQQIFKDAAWEAAALGVVAKVAQLCCVCV